MKKTALGVVLVLSVMTVLALGVEKTTGLVGVGWDKFSAWVKGTITPEMQLDLARKQVERLDVAIARAKDELVPEIQAVDKESAEVVSLERDQAKRETVLRELRENLDRVSGSDKSEPQKNLAGKWSEFKAKAKELSARKETLTVRQDANKQALTQIGEMENSKQLLKAEIERLAAELRLARLREKNAKSFDGGRLTEINSLLGEVNDHVERLEIRRKLDLPTKDVKDTAAQDAQKELDEFLSRKDTDSTTKR